MQGRYLFAVLFFAVQLSALATVAPVRAQEQAAGAGLPAHPPLPERAPVKEAALKPPLPSPDPASTQSLSAPDGGPPLVSEPLPQSPADPVVAIIRAKLADSDMAKGADADDLAALKAFYGTRAGPPVWMTDMGFLPEGQSALFEIEMADGWGLDAEEFDLPAADMLPESPEAQAMAEIELSLAILKYARFARGGRLIPARVSRLFDQEPPLRDPGTVLAEMETAEAPDAYLRSLHPKHEQFVRLRQALLKTRAESDKKGNAARDSVATKRIILNMERWRWMPEDLGALHVRQNSPEFMVYVVRDGKTIYADKTQVGTIRYATPVFTADMKTIVFNPSWVAPPTVLKENLAPPLRQGQFSVLKTHKLSVSYRGKPVDATKIDWGRVNIHDYTFTQKPGPDNVLGKAKFLFPNKHIVYMHDTHPVRRKFYDKSVRAVGHECVRMEKPLQFAQALLAQDKGWPAARVKDLWDGSVDGAVALEQKIPVHMTYFTVWVDEAGKLETFADLYGLDKKHAAALFGSVRGFPPPPPEASGPPESEMEAVNAPARAAPTRRSELLQAFRRD